VVIDSQITDIVIDFSCPLNIRRVDQYQRIEFHLMAFQTLDSLKDFGMGSAAADVSAILIMENGGTVDTDPHQSEYGDGHVLMHY